MTQFYTEEQLDILEEAANALGWTALRGCVTRGADTSRVAAIAFSITCGGLSPWFSAADLDKAKLWIGGKTPTPKEAPAKPRWVRTFGHGGADATTIGIVSTLSDEREIMLMYRNDQWSNKDMDAMTDNILAMLNGEVKAPAPTVIDRPDHLFKRTIVKGQCCACQQPYTLIFCTGDDDEELCDRCGAVIHPQTKEKT